VNVAPVVSNDGQTVYTLSRAHFASDFSYMVAANADLTPKWHTSLRNLGPSRITGIVYDLSSSTPAVAPDGSILYGAQGGSEFRGYLLKLSSTGQFLSSYDFGWDTTPAIYRHDGTYSVILKDNHYVTDGPFYITQLNASLLPEWSFLSASNREWCVNAPAVDANGVVYVNNEDGNVYAINQGGTQKGKIFLRRAIGAAYTPVAIGLDGKLYTENAGDMFVVGQ
jgi:outer membrane protein assembly factor BamB